MKSEFKKSLQIAAEDKNFILITGDLGFDFFEDFQESFPDQFINVGVAEQNMIGIACGLALNHKKVFVYSIGNFPTLRCLEQIRNGICYHNLSITIVAMGGGFSYGALGFSHHATEDISILRSLPNMNVFCPGTNQEMNACFKECHNNSSPNYLRLDKTTQDLDLENRKITEPQVYSSGGDAIIFSCGGIIKECFKASVELKEHQINLDVCSVPCTKPLPSYRLREIIKNYEYVLTIEENNLVNGFGASIRMICDDIVKKDNFFSFGIDDKISSIVGSQDFLRTHNEISSKFITNKIKEMIL